MFLIILFYKYVCYLLNRQEYLSMWFWKIYYDLTSQLIIKFKLKMQEPFKVSIRVKPYDGR